MPSGPAGTDHRENLFEIFVLFCGNYLANWTVASLTDFA